MCSANVLRKTKPRLRPSQGHGRLEDTAFRKTELASVVGVNEGRVLSASFLPVLQRVTPRPSNTRVGSGRELEPVRIEMCLADMDLGRLDMARVIAT